MRTKTVTIHNWDGSKYDVEAPAQAKYLGILSHSGYIRFYRSNPTKAKDVEGYFAPSSHCIPGVGADCPEANLPYHDGYSPAKGTGELLLKIEEV